MAGLARELREHNCDFLTGEDVSRLEPMADFVQRMEQLKEWLWQHAPDHDLLLVAHSEVAFMLTAEIVDGERFGQSLENAEVVET